MTVCGRMFPSNRHSAFCKEQQPFFLFLCGGKKAQSGRSGTLKWPFPGSVGQEVCHRERRSQDECSGAGPPSIRPQQQQTTAAALHTLRCAPHAADFVNLCDAEREKSARNTLTIFTMPPRYVQYSTI